MQKTKVLQIGPRSFTLKELSVVTVWDLMNNRQAKSPDTKPVSQAECFRELLSLSCPELTAEVLLSPEQPMYPSEIEELWQGFEEVNAAFLGVVRTIGLDRALIEAAREVGTSIVRYAFLSNPAMAPASGTTAMVSS